MEDTTLCDEIIDFFNSSPELQDDGKVGNKDGLEPFVQKDVKDSTDMPLNFNRELYMKYMDHIRECVGEYYKIWEYGDFHPITDEQYTNIQYYKPNGGYKKWHAETCSAKFPMVSRHLTYMTYLNDVTDAGETEYYYQNVKVKPEKGLTLIWTGSWMHTHRGIPSPTQEKYIATGWLNLERDPSDDTGDWKDVLGQWGIRLK